MAVKKKPVPKKKGPVKKKAAAAPNYADSTYNKQISYYNKLLADFNAQQTRQTNDTGTYYGNLARGDTKTAVKDKKGKQIFDTKKQLLGFKNDTKKTKTGSKWVTTTVKGKKVKKKVDVFTNVPTGKHHNVYKTTKTGRTKTTKGSAATQGLYQKELATTRGKDLTSIADDYAARGMIHSGLYAQKRGDYETEYGKQLAETNRQKTKQYGDISAEKTQFTREQELQREQAKLEAIRRRAALSGSLGI